MDVETIMTIEREIEGLLVQYDAALAEKQDKLAVETMQQIEAILDGLPTNEVKLTTETLQ